MISRYRRIRGALGSIYRRVLSATPLGRWHRRAVFDAVYKSRLWGTDEKFPFFSGVGSHGAPAAIYVEALAPILATHLGELGPNAQIVDLGCGDFAVGSQLLERLPPVRYVGCDIVPDLVRYNRARFGNEHVEFRLVDIVTQPLPPGDICLVRQVLQHLPNRDISRVLRQLRRYKHVYVTEGQPPEREGRVNPDMRVGGSIRFDSGNGRGRGVELDQPPFRLQIDEICRAPAPPKEIIVTYRVRF